jgi:hypothetical protein
MEKVKKIKHEQEKMIEKDKKKHKKNWKNKIVKRDWRVRSESATTIKVYICIPPANDLGFYVESTEIIGNFKKEIKPQTGYFPHQYRLQYNGELLEDQKTFSDYQIGNKSRIALVLHSGMAGYGYKHETIVI